MKRLILLFLTALLISCGTTKSNSQNRVESNSSLESSSSTTQISTDSNKRTEARDFAKVYAESIAEDELKKILYEFSDDKFEGRKTGEKGQKLASKFLMEYYKNLGIVAANADGNYLQHIPVEYFRGRSDDSSENVVAYIKGTEKPDEFIVISAHYDHLGIQGEKIFNGADDDASGTTAVLIIAKAFKKALDEGKGPKRSIVFLHATGEEEGLLGSRYYAEHPIFPLEGTVANLNIDMIGRFDQKHADNPEFVYLIGSDKISSELHALSEETNKKYTNLILDYTYNDESDPNRFYYRSDHYNFAKNGIPIIFYFNGVHNDYHRETDTADKIRYDLLHKRTQLIFHTAWEISNKENRLVIDKN